MNNRMNKIAVFIDGNFFLTVSNYYKFQHSQENYIQLNGLVKFIREEVARQEQLPVRFCQVIESHWFRGRYNTSQIEQMNPDEDRRLKQLTNERFRNDLFMYNGIVQHVYPVHYDSRTGRTVEKGIDVWLSLEAYELAVVKEYDVMVLIAGDTDYVPLIRKINGLGTRVMVLGWDFEYELPNGKRHVTRTSQALMDECSYPIPMADYIDDMEDETNPSLAQLFGDL